MANLNGSIQPIITESSPYFCNSFLVIAPKKSSAAKAEHAKCCSGKPAPAKNKQPPSGGRECCKSIHAVPLPDAKGLAKFDASLFVIHAFSLHTVLGSEAAALDALATLHDHGPPRADSFAELVLNRSLLSHAPPFTA